MKHQQENDKNVLQTFKTVSKKDKKTVKRSLTSNLFHFKTEFKGGEDKSKLLCVVIFSKWFLLMSLIM